METRVPADEGAAPSGEQAGGPVVDPVERRLNAIEDRLDALETSIREAITQELAGTGEEMRRAVSELGRLMLRDLDRLTKVLAEHRDAIVERLRPDVSGDPPDPPVVAADDPDPPAPPAPGKGEEGRWWAFPTRRRQKRP